MKFDTFNNSSGGWSFGIVYGERSFVFCFYTWEITVAW